MLRFAPSPTADMHIGNLRVALFNYILSKQLNKPLVIRVEDIDKEKNINGKDREILEILHKFNIEYKNIVYQNHNLKFHQQIAMQLLTNKKAFSCFCSSDVIDKKIKKAKKDKKPYRYDDVCEKLSDEEVLNKETPLVVRLKRPQENIKFKDKIKGNLEYKPYDVDSFTILRVDKNPTYNFACSIDDMLMDISIVIRDEDYLSETAKQIAVREILGYDKEIKYIHIPSILNENDKKEELSVNSLLEQGFLPEAIANYLISLGNNSEKEIFTLKEAIEFFDISKISNSSVKFDLNKLKLINREHIKIMDSLALSKEVGFADREIGELVKLYAEDIDTTNEIKIKIDAIFSKKNPTEFIDEFNTLKRVIKDMKLFDDFDSFKREAVAKSGLESEIFLKTFKFILTGDSSDTGVKIERIYPLIKNYLGQII